MSIVQHQELNGIKKTLSGVRMAMLNAKAT